MATPLPQIQIRHSETVSGGTWTVRATWSDGKCEEIAGFQSEAAAEDWITNKFQSWLEDLTKARKS